jgi:hypothetical protein
MTVPNNGSRWTAYDGNIFRVISTEVIENKTWIYYTKENLQGPNEYSCYLESFLSRFTELPK